MTYATPKDSSGIYRITCNAGPGARFDGWVYYGQAKSLADRFKRHIWELNAGVHANALMLMAWRMHGPKAFSFDVVEVVGPIADVSEFRRALCVAEQKYLDEAFGFSCFNVCAVAESRLGVGHTPEVRARMSISRTGKKMPPQAVAKTAAAKIGKKRPPHVGAAVADSNRNRIYTPETRAKMSASQTGKKMSHEAVEKSAAARRGQIMSDEQRAKISATLTGRTLCQEHKDKVAAAGIGRKYPPEFGAAISARMKGKRPDAAIAAAVAVLTGKNQDPEVVARRAEGNRLAWARRKAAALAASSAAPSSEAA